MDPIRHLDAALRKGLQHPPTPNPKPRTPAPLPTSPELARDRQACPKKTPYRTAQAAVQVKERNEALDPGLRLKYYRCLHCHLWHLTKDWSS